MNPRTYVVTTDGFLARGLIGHWLAAGHHVRVITRYPNAIKPAERLEVFQWDARTPGDWTAALEGADALVNLAGRSVDCRYHRRNRELILNSRVDSTRLLAEALKTVRRPPSVWLNAASATIYRHADDGPQDETNGELGHGFSVDVCRAWERTFFDTDIPTGIRRVALRAAIVLGRGGGVLPVFRKLALAGLAGRIGPGTQMFSWIHRDDFCRAIDWLIEHTDLDGPVNLAAPNPVTMDEFTRRLRQQIGNPVGIPLPRPLLEIGAWLIRAETELLLKSRWVTPGRLLEAGYRFTHPNLEPALHDLIP